MIYAPLQITQKKPKPIILLINAQLVKKDL